jgi:hypothetical protein
MKPFHVVVRKFGGGYCYTAWGESVEVVHATAVKNHPDAYVAVGEVTA